MLSRYGIATVLLCLAVIFVALGVAVYLPEEERQQGITRCVAVLSLRDPVKDAKDDYRRGERRFYFRNHNGISMYMSADGIPDRPDFVDRSNGCEPTELARRANMWRPDLYPEHDRYYSAPGLHCCDRDPPRTMCGRAMDRYLVAYNAEMAKVSPGSIEQYCEMKD